MSIIPPMKALVIGAGIYGIEIALFLKQAGINTEIVEESSQICARATFANQARVHNGYHYPRNYLTALRSHENYSKFIEDHKGSIGSSFQHYYAIAKHNSKITASYFMEFVRKIGTPLSESLVTEKLFNISLIDNSYRVEECVFDAKKLTKELKYKLKKSNITVHFNTSISSLQACKKLFSAEIIINTTYSRINTFLHNSKLPLLPLKHEVTEIALIQPPTELKNFGITVMDGPFFSMLPFPALGCYSLTHVRFTPHSSWIDQDGFKEPYLVLNLFKKRSKYRYMIADACRYVPLLAKSRYLKSLWEIKTVLIENENDDGRPILYRKDYNGIKNLFLIMGGKIDNIYDVLERLRSDLRIIKS